MHTHEGPNWFLSAACFVSGVLVFFTFPTRLQCLWIGCLIVSQILTKYVNPTVAAKHALKSAWLALLLSFLLVTFGPQWG